MRNPEEEIELLRAALNGIPDTVFIKDVSGRYIFINEAGARLIGTPPQEVIGKTDMQLFTAEEAARFRRKDQMIRETGKNETYEEEILLGGEIHTLKTTKIPYRDAKGRVIGVLGASEDITAQKRAESALNLYQERLALITENTSDVVVLYDVEKDGSFTHIFANHAALEYPGLRRDEVIGKTLQDIFDENLARRIEECGRECIQSKKTVTAEIPIKSKTKSFILGATFTAIFDATKNSVHVLLVGRDISARKREERRQALLSSMSAILLGCLESEQSLRAAAQLIARELADYCVIFVSDENGSPIFFDVTHNNPKLADEARSKLLRRRPDAFIGSSRIMKTGRPILISELSEDLKQEFFPDKGFREYLDQIQLRSLMYLPLHDREKTVGTILFASTDSERRYNQTDLNFAEELCYRLSLAWQNFRLYDEAQNSIRLRDEFLSIASHELKTPMTPIAMSLQLIERSIKEGSESRLNHEQILNILGVARSQFVRLNRLIEDLLDVSKITSGKFSLKFERVDLYELVQKVANDFREQLDDSGSSVRITSEGQTTAELDRYRIEEVIINLILNAIKFAPGKPIEIRIRGQAEEAVILEVQDFGIGIRKEDQSRIFGRFERGVPMSSYGGLGLGLFISNQIIHSHGGSIRVESEPGKGSTFIIELPVIACDKTKAA